MAMSQKERELRYRASQGEKGFRMMRVWVHELDRETFKEMVRNLTQKRRIKEDQGAYLREVEALAKVKGVSNEEKQPI